MIATFSLRFGRKHCDNRPTQTSKTNDYARCWLHHCVFRNERKMKDKHELITLNEKAWWSILLSNLEVSGKPNAECVQKRAANAQRTQADHSKQESLMTSFSRDPEVSGKPDAVFQCHNASSQNTFSERDRSNEPGNLFESVHCVCCSDKLLGSHFLMDTGIICLIRQGLKLWSRNIKWNLLKVVSMSFSNKLMFKDWNWRTPITDILKLEEKQSRHQEELSMKEKRVSRDSDTNIHEMGEMKRAQELESTNLCTRIEIKSSDNTKAHFTSARNARADEFYDWFRGISRSGIESQCENVRTFPFNQQWFQALVLSWAATNACRLTHGIRLDCRKTFLVINFSTFDSSTNHHQGIHHSTTPSGAGSVLVRIGTRTHVTRDEDRNRSTIPMPTFARKPLTISLFFPVNNPQNSMVGQKRQDRNFNSTNSLHLLHFFMLEDKIQKTKWLLVLIFHRRLCYRSKK